jgi:hypothetical protein
MERYGRIFIIFLFFINILFVFMGYAGISKLERDNSPPFNKGLVTAVCDFDHIPNNVILFWHSTPGTVIVWSCCILLPFGAYVLLYQQKLAAGILLLLLSIIPFGVVGLFIWLHAALD